MNAEQDIQSKNLVDEEQVKAYLKANPDFFKEHAELLVDLNFTHDTKGEAVSLIQRQVELLRNHLAQNRERLAELATNAKHNESLLTRFQALSIALVTAKDHNHAISILQRVICLDFGLSLVEVVVPENTWPEPMEQVISLPSEDYKEFSNSVYNIPIYLGKTPDNLREGVLNNKNELARSIAMIKISFAEHEGYVVIGSKDEHHFQNDMGTEFVTSIGDYLNAVLSRSL